MVYKSVQMVKTKESREIIESDAGRFFDFVKAMGIIGIFCFHFYDRFLAGFKIKDALESGLLHNLFTGIRTFGQFVSFVLQVFFALGYMGVELFIIASGFGLYFSYLMRKDPWPQFYKKRAVRVLPLYYFFLLLYFVLTVFASEQTFYASSEGIKVLAYHLLLLQAFNGSYEYYGLLYFVAIIFQLYLLFPALIKLMKDSAARVLLFILFLISSSVINMILAFYNIHYSGILITDFLPFFFLGMMIAQSIYNNENFHKILFDRRASFLFTVLLFIIVYYCIGNAYFTKEMRRLIALLIFLSLPFVFSFVKHLKAKKVIAFVAYTSYPFYLMHMIFINRLNILAAHLGLLGSYRGWLSVGIVSFLSALAVAYSTQKGYDRIITTIRNRNYSTGSGYSQ